MNKSKLMIVAMVGVMALSSFAGKYYSRKIPYGDTLRDRFWMWGHNPYLMNVINEGLLAQGKRYLEDAEVRPNIEMAEACKFMGIPNLYCIMLREFDYAGGFEKYCESLKDLKRVGWGVADGNTTVSQEEKIRFGTQAAWILPNLTNWCCDDFYVGGKTSHLTQDALRELRGRARLPGVNLSVVLYADQGGIKDEVLKELEIFDTILLWVWNSKNLGSVEASIDQLRKAYGSRKEIQLGLYMFDFGGGEKLIPADVMKSQLAVAYKLIKAHKVDGLIFHCTPMVQYDVDAINISRQWIKEHGEENW